MCGGTEEGREDFVNELDVFGALGDSWSIALYDALKVYGCRLAIAQCPENIQFTKSSLSSVPPHTGVLPFPEPDCCLY